MIIEKVDSNASLSNFGQSKVFDWVDHGSLLDSPSLYVPQSDGEDRSSSLFLDWFVNVLCSPSFFTSLRWTRFCKSWGPTWPQFIWRFHDGQLYRSLWRYRRACGEQCQGGWGQIRNPIVWSCYEKSIGLQLIPCKSFALLVPSIGWTANAWYSASRLVPISLWRKITRKYWIRSWPLLTFGYEEGSP